MGVLNLAIVLPQVLLFELSLFFISFVGWGEVGG